ncbi:nucleotidyltransferase substrate binding protein [Jeotgalibacillus alimentarius]
MISKKEAWLQMLKDRNETSHTYNEDLAREILSNIHGYFPEMKAVFTFLKSKFQEG